MSTAAGRRLRLTIPDVTVTRSWPEKFARCSDTGVTATLAGSLSVIGTAVILTQQNLLSVGGDGDKIILGAVLAGVLVFWPQGLIGLWQLARTAVRQRAS